MTEQYYNFLLTELTRVTKLGGKNIQLHILLNNKEKVVCNYTAKPMLDNGVLQIVEPFSEPTTLSDTQGGTKIITKTTGVRRHFALSEIAMVEINFDILQETTVEPIVPPVEEESAE